jgi:4-hydroxy-tetrahydrodipicolinate synthase
MSVTTFSPQGDLDEEQFRLWLRQFVDLRLGVYVGSGGNGEGHALLPDELRRVYEIAVEELKGKVPLHANLPEEHTARQTIAQARIAAEAGIEMLHMYTLEGRHGMKPTDRELITYYDDVLAEIDTGVCVAINPTVGRIPKPAVVAEIVHRHPNVKAIRLSHQPEAYLIELRDRIAGDIEYYYQFNTGALGPLALGASLFSAEGNLLPKTLSQFLDFYELGNLAEATLAMAHIRRAYDYCKNFGSNPRWMKMAIRGLKRPGWEGGPRRPYLMPSDEEQKAFMDGLLKLRVPEIDEYARAIGLALPE